MPARPSQRFPSPRSARGFTLIEVLVAFVLLAVGLGLLLAILSDGVRAVSRANGSTQASLYAESLLATLGSDQRLRIGHTEGRFEGGSYRWALDVAPYALPPPAAPPNGAPGSVDPGLQSFVENEMLHVLLTVRWGTPEVPQSLRVETLRAYAPDAGAVR